MMLNHIAESYVKIILGIGKHSENYVDAYYGPLEWKNEPKKTLSELLTLTDTLIADIKKINPLENEKQRKKVLFINLISVRTYILHLSGKKFRFDEESVLLYDAKSPLINEYDLDIHLKKLEELLPGNGDLNKRMEKFSKNFIIPKDRLDIVFKAAMKESKRVTKKYIQLDDNENFNIEYVTNKVWSGYNWYKGKSYSLIELNTDFPMYIDRAVDLASHEGYPGHHVFNSLIEKHLVDEKAWLEYSIYPLYSPLSLLAEGSANYGIELCFNKEDRMKFEKEILFPLAGLDNSYAKLYYEVQDILNKLTYAGNMVAKKYLDGDIKKEKAIELLMKYSLTSKKRTIQRIGFIEEHRSYVINYNLGQDIVKNYIEKIAGDNEEKKWQAFTELLKNPKTSSMMLQ